MSIKNIYDTHKNSLPWLEDRTILLVRHGSHAYGTNIETSDEDFKGVAIPPMKYVLGFNSRFEQAECKEPDAVIYSLQKFMKLAADCNPNILEVLWVDDSDIVHDTELGKKLRANRNLFLSRKAKHTFSGYAASQLKRIKGHYRWLKNPPTHEPTRAEYKLPERTVVPANQLEAARSAVQKQIDSWQMDLSFLDQSLVVAVENEVHRILDEQFLYGDAQWQSAARAINLSDNFIEFLDLERRYQSARSDWEKYNNWKTTRNEARAELEAKFGYDTKHAMHLVRLLRMCREILEGKGVIVKRHDAEDLLAIRNGAWTYEQLVEWAEQEDKALSILVNDSALPKRADVELLDALCVDLINTAKEYVR